MNSNVNFGSAKIIMQSMTLAPWAEHRKRRQEAVKEYRRETGRPEIIGPDPECSAYVDEKVGPENFNYDQLHATKKEKFKAYLEKLSEENKPNPNYRALLFYLGLKENPLNPSEDAAQALLIDGEDVAGFMTDAIGEGSCAYLEDKKAFNFDNAIRNYEHRTTRQIQEGQIDKLLDLDA